MAAWSGWCKSWNAVAIYTRMWKCKSGNVWHLFCCVHRSNSDWFVLHVCLYAPVIRCYTLQWFHVIRSSDSMLYAPVIRCYTLQWLDVIRAGIIWKCVIFKCYSSEQLITLNTLHEVVPTWYSFHSSVDLSNADKVSYSRRKHIDAGVRTVNLLYPKSTF